MFSKLVILKFSNGVEVRIDISCSPSTNNEELVKRALLRLKKVVSNDGPISFNWEVV